MNLAINNEVSNTPLLLQSNSTTIFILMSKDLRIELQDADSGDNLGYLITSVKIESCINKDMIVTLGSRLRGDFFEERAKLDDIEDVILSIEGGFSSPKFHMTLYLFILRIVLVLYLNKVLN